MIFGGPLRITVTEDLLNSILDKDELNNFIVKEKWFSFVLYPRMSSVALAQYRIPKRILTKDQLTHLKSIC